MKQYAVIHYHEIGLKGKNRSHFENRLISNIITKTGARDCRRESGQIVLFAEDLQKHEEQLKQIPGIAFFSPSTRSNLELEEIKSKALEFASAREFSTFRITTKRHNKQYKHTSQELNRLIGAEIMTKLKKKVQLVAPDLDLKVEISNHNAYFSDQDIKGVGGLPTDKKQKVVVLLSGGLDSPVAAYMMMKRGCEVILVHFQNENIGKQGVEGKIQALTKQLSKYQLTTTLHIVPFGEIQKEIIKNSKSEIRMLIYRRIMLKIASEIAKKNKALFLVTGDSLCQVASQTPENLYATYQDSPLPVLSPLIGFDKMEVVAIAREIGTYDISAQQEQDCCSYFLAKHPELRADLRVLQRFELDENLIKQAIENSRTTTL